MNTKSLADYLQKLMSKLCPIISMSLYVLFFSMMFGLSYFGILLLFTIQQKLGNWFYLHFAAAMWVIFNIIFNYVMTILVKPGSPNDIPRSLLSQIKITCRKCGVTKPPRTHHCSLCDQCVLQMDHHCPWIGNCVGHHNRRYFLNFLTYITLGLTYILILTQTRSIDSVVFVLVVTLEVCLGGFTIAHWYFALIGENSIEICWKDPRYKPSKSFKTNLRIIFETSNLFLCLMPSIKVLQNNGQQWQIV